MELIAREDNTITIRFCSTEVVDLMCIAGAASQGYACLDRELLDHLTREEVSAVSDELVRVIGGSRKDV